MSFLQSIALGIIQGVSEFIPISSSGHLVVGRAIMGIGEVPLLYDVILHVATLIVVIVFFRQRISKVLAALFRWFVRKSTDQDASELRLLVAILVATVVTVIIGLSIRQFDLHLYPRVVSVAFLLTAGLLIASHFLGGNIDYSSIRSKHAVLVGAMQGFSVIPGISRSGSTIFAALASGVSREKAGEFSFLLSIPAILGALLIELSSFGDLNMVLSPTALITGFVAAMVFGYLSLSLLVRLIRGGKLWVFSIYLIPLGVAGFFFL
ncbi:MAG: undecaprenyl-diphosphate phosphatase [Spirochaetota bacterium]